MKNKFYFIVFFLAFCIENHSLQAQAKIISVWDQGHSTRITEEEKMQRSPLVEGMRLQANDFIEIQKDHLLVLLLDEGTKIYLEGPGNYSVPNVAWELVGYVSFKEKQEKLFGGLFLKKGAILMLSEGYQLFLSDSDKNIKQLSGPLQYKVIKPGYCIEGYKKATHATSLVEYSPSIQELPNLGSIQTVRSSDHKQNFQKYPYPLFPRKLLKSNQHIQFRWTPILSESGEVKECVYVLTVTDIDKKVLFTVQTKDTFYQVPFLEVPLTENYFWSVSLLDEEPAFEKTLQFLSHKELKWLQDVELPLQNQLAQNAKQLDLWWSLLILYHDKYLFSDAFLVIQQLSQHFGMRPKKMFPLYYKIAIEQLEMTPEELQIGFLLDIRKMAQEVLPDVEISLETKTKIYKQLGLSDSK